jgi:hypothetical protein
MIESRRELGSPRRREARNAALPVKRGLALGLEGAAGGSVTKVGEDMGGEKFLFGL